MSKYKDLAAVIIQNVGGPENIESVRHCITRVRFHLKDESKANDEALKHTKGIMAVVHGGGEYMCVIGDEVENVYNAVCVQLGLKPEGDTKVTAGTEMKKKPIDRALSFIGASMGPTLNLLCACGMIKGALALLTMAGLSTGSGIYMLLNAMGDAIFYVMPVFIGFNAAKNLGIDPYFGFLFGAALTYPTIQGVDISLLGMTVNATYTSSFLPVLFGLLIAAPLYRFFGKHIAKSFKGFLVPMLTLLIALPLTFTIVGPAANAIGSALGTAFNFLFDKVPLLAYPLLSGFWQILVMFGIHGMLTMFSFVSLMSGTPSSMIGASMVTSYVVTGVLCGMIVRNRKNVSFKSTLSASAVSAFLGVTEPAMYGIIIPRRKLLILTCIVNAIAGFFAGLAHLTLYFYTGMGPTGLIGLINPQNPNLISILFVVLLGFVTGFLTSYFFMPTETQEAVPDEKTNAVSSSETNGISIASAVDGSVRSVTESSDPAFVSESLGKGVVIEPGDDTVYAPVTGTIVTLFPTKHAIGIKGDNGAEVLIHVGINTVNLQGKYFTAYAKQGDHVELGQKLLTFDRTRIANAGYSNEVLEIITNTDSYLDVIAMEKDHGMHGKEAMRLLCREGN